MQSAETEHSLANLDRDRITDMVLRLLDQRTHDDRQEALNTLDRNVVYQVRGGSEHYPFFGRWLGVEGMHRMLGHLATEFENLGSRVHRVVIDGNDVAVQRTATMRHRGTNMVGNIDIVNFLRFRDGLIVEISELFDSVAIDRMKKPPRSHKVKDGLLSGMQSPADVFGPPAKVAFGDSSVEGAFRQVVGRINEAVKKERKDLGGSKE